jgi:hypothetical protein
MPAASAQTGSEPGGAKWFKQARARAAHALQGKERARQAEAEKHLHEIETQKAQLTSQLEALEPGMEGVVLHFVAERMKGPRPLRAADAAAQTTMPAQQRYGRLHRAIEDGEVEMVRVGLREFLSLPSHLVPNARKVHWLRGPTATSTLKFFAQRYCGFLDDEERKTCEAIKTYIDEIVSSPYLTPSDKTEICGKLELDEPRRGNGGEDGLSLVPALRNSAVAACVLLGIYESSAELELKRALLTALAAPWSGGIGACVHSVGASLVLYKHRAPEWVDGFIARLQCIETGLEGTPVTGN